MPCTAHGAEPGKGRGAGHLRPAATPLAQGCAVDRWREEKEVATLEAGGVLRADPTGFFLSWRAPDRAAEVVDMCYVSDVYFGDLPKDSRLRSQLARHGEGVKDRTLTIVTGPDFVNITHHNYVFPSDDDAKDWLKGLREIIHDRKRWNISVQMNLRKQWTYLTLSVDAKGNLLVRTVVDFLIQTRTERQSLVLALSDLGMDLIKNKSIEPESFTFEKFLHLYNAVCTRPDLDALYAKLSEGDVRGISVEQMRCFLNQWQRDPRCNEILCPLYDKPRAAAFIDAYEMDEDAKTEGRMSRLGLERFLTSDDCLPLDPAKLDLFMDMKQPLAHYFINSSHNTYLIGRQFGGRSSVEMYRQVLLSGCRCVELDCWDGPGGEPIITHGRAMCSDVPLKDVLEVVADSAFLASQAPVVLSIENHCSKAQQEVMAKWMEQILSPALLKESLPDFPLEPGVPLPSPAQLMGRILVKNKRLKQEVEKRELELFRHGELPLEESDSDTGDAELNGDEDAVDDGADGADDSDAVPDIPEIAVFDDDGQTSPTEPGDKNETNVRVPGAKMESDTDLSGAVSSADAVNTAIKPPVNSVSNSTASSITKSIINAATSLVTNVASSLTPRGSTSEATNVAASVPTNVPSSVATNVATSAATNVPTNVPTSAGTNVAISVATNVPSSMAANVAISVATNVPTSVATNVAIRVATDVATSVATKGAANVVTNVATGAATSVATTDATGTVTNVATSAAENVATNMDTNSDTNEATNVANSVITSGTTSSGTCARTGTAANSVARSPSMSNGSSSTTPRILSFRAARYSVSSVGSKSSTDSAVIAATDSATRSAIIAATNAASKSAVTNAAAKHAVVTAASAASTTNSAGRNTDTSVEVNIQVAMKPADEDSGNAGSEERTQEVTTPGLLAPPPGSPTPPDSARGPERASPPPPPPSEEEDPGTRVRTSTSAGETTHICSTSKVHPLLSSLVKYVESVRFPGFALAKERNLSFHISSFSETTGSNVLRSQAMDLVEYNKVQISRIYPKGIRTDSSNFMPHLFWSAGCQMVALNFQTPDLPMQLNQGKFECNDNCGYILKPDFLRRRDRQFNPFADAPVDGVVAGQCSIQVISGQFLCERQVGTYVEVDMFGLPTDTVHREFCTRTVPFNGLNPVYNEPPFLFRKLVLPELALVRVAACEEGGRVLGQRVLPLNGLQAGFRHVGLRSEAGLPLPLATLFLLIEFEIYIPEGFEALASNLREPQASVSPALPSSCPGTPVDSPGAIRRELSGIGHIHSKRVKEEEGVLAWRHTPPSELREKRSFRKLMSTHARQLSDLRRAHQRDLRRDIEQQCAEMDQLIAGKDAQYLAADADVRLLVRAQSARWSALRGRHRCAEWAAVRAQLDAQRFLALRLLDEEHAKQKAHLQREHAKEMKELQIQQARASVQAMRRIAANGEANSGLSASTPGSVGDVSVAAGCSGAGRGRGGRAAWVGSGLFGRRCRTESERQMRERRQQDTKLFVEERRFLLIRQGKEADRLVDAQRRERVGLSHQLLAIQELYRNEEMEAALQPKIETYV